MKTIFRRIGGKIVPINIGSKKVSSSMGMLKDRDILAKVNGERVGYIAIGQKIKNPKTLKLHNIDVDPKFRQQGIASSMFDHLVKLAQRAGYKRIEGSELVSPHAAKIRAKHGSKFYLGSSKRKITTEDALRRLNKFEKEWSEYSSGKVKSRPKYPEIRAVTTLKGKKK